MQVNGKVDGQVVSFIQTTEDTWETVVPHKDSYVVEVTATSDTGNVTYATQYVTDIKQAVTNTKLIYAGEITSASISLKSNTKLLVKEMIFSNKSDTDAKLNIQIENVYLINDLTINASDSFVFKLFTVVDINVPLLLAVDKLNALNVIISGTEVIDI